MIDLGPDIYSTSMKVAFLFSGQGAQAPGMGKDVGGDVFKKADEILGFELSEICFNGPQETLNKTDICQPALLTTSIALLRAFKKPDAEVVAMTGLSLGEYTALVACGVLSFEDGLRIVRQRGHFMQEACDSVKSGMASVIGMERSKIEAIVAEVAKDGVVNVANYNSPDQIVISGEETALKKAIELLTKAGARRVIPLKVAGAYHSSIMKRAEEKLLPVLENAKFSDASIPFMSNSHRRLMSSGAEIKGVMKTQISSPVFWEDSIRILEAQGVTGVYEFGPGNILCALVRKISPSIETTSVSTV